MCFAPQQRALFRHLNFQKWSEREVFLSFSLANVLRATTACTFSTSQLPKVRRWCVLCILTSKCASRPNGGTFSTSQLPKVARTWGVFSFFHLQMCFAPQTACTFSSLIWPAGSAPAALASLLFDPPEAQIIGKTQVFCDFPTFSRICIFFLLTLSLLFLIVFLLLFSSLTLPISAFHLSILSEVWLLNFLRLYPHDMSSLNTQWYQLICIYIYYIYILSHNEC